jgi:DNA-binding transcriptional LysR family regulator
MDDDALYLAVIDGGSFRAAALASGLDPSRVSRRIAALEDRLGVKLLNRTTRASSATQAGLRYAEGVRRLKEARAALLAEVTGGQDMPSGRLRVTAPTDFGARFIAPVLSQMAQEFPNLSVDFRLGSAQADLLAEGIDVAIRIGQLTDSTLIARRIGVSRRVLVAAPELAKTITSPGDLSHINIIPYRTGITDMRIELELDGVADEIRMPCRFCVNSMSAVREAVLAGHGVHLGPEWTFDEDLKAGRVVSVVPGAKFSAFPIHAVWSPTPFQPAASRVFVQRSISVLRNKGLS